jgi:hypothetical protein
VEHLHTILEVKFDNWTLAFEVFEGVLLLNNFKLLGISRFNSIENEYEKVSQHVEHFEIMFFNGHFHIESRELAKVTVGVGVLSSKDWSNLKNTIEIGTESHLLVKLGTLGKACLLTEVLHLEDIGTAFRGTGNHFRGMNLYEIVLHHEFSVEAADAGL